MTLTQLFTNIANAIRAKTGSIEKIKAEDFPNEIENIVEPTGTIEITENGTYDVTNYASAEVDVQGGTSEYNAKIDENGVLEVATTGQDSYIINKLLEEFPIVDTSSWTSTNYMFYMCRKITRIPQLNTSKVTRMQYMFAYCIRLSEIPQLDTSGVNDMRYMFQSCSALTAIPQLNTSNLGQTEGMFNNCRNLILVPQLDTSNVTYMQNMFQACSSLSEESLNNILAMCTSAVKITRNKTLKFIGLTEAQATTCQSLSNYQAFLDAGWTTGY